jgi:hypothetical protein
MALPFAKAEGKTSYAEEMAYDEKMTFRSGTPTETKALENDGHL